MKNIIVMKKSVFSFLLLMFACSSCSHHSSQVNSYISQDTVYVNTHLEEDVKLDSCEIVQVIPLSMPQSLIDFEQFSKMVLKGDRIYVFDRRVNKNTVSAFDMTGKFLFTVGGKKGRARRELIGDVAQFDVDGNGNVYLYDRSGRKILVFNDKGVFDHVVMLYDYLPSSMKVSDDGENFYFSLDNFSSRKRNTALVLADKEGKEIKTLFDLGVEDNLYDVESRPLTKDPDGVVSYLPALADFALDVRGDSVSCVKFSFDTGFLTDEELETSRKTQRMLSNLDHASMIMKYSQSSRFLYMEYIMSNETRSLLIDKVQNRSYNIHGLFGFPSLYCHEEPYIFGDTFAWLVYPSEIERDKEWWGDDLPVNLHPVTKKMVLGEISTPAVVLLKLK